MTITESSVGASSPEVACSGSTSVGWTGMRRETS